MLDTSGFTDKDSKRPEYRELYETLPFVEAYATHTDMRIQKDGPHLAIGAKADGLQDWEIHGKEQFDFLVSRGLAPGDTLLDLGCGTGRLARQVVPYLDPGHYTGLDISAGAIGECMKLAQAEGWGQRSPRFVYGDGSLFDAKVYGPFTRIWAHSVLTHLPPEIVTALFEDLSEMEFAEFCFTFKGLHQLDPQRNHRTGLKQFKYRIDWLIEQAEKQGLKAQPLPRVWPAGQQTMRVWR